MLESSGEERRRVFAIWLRTGRRPVVQSADAVEVKYNPWHDPDDGRFTFANTGRHYADGQGGGRTERPRPAGGGAAAGRATGPARPSKSSADTEPRKRPRPQQPAAGGWMGGGFTGGGGGGFGGGGASGNWGEPERPKVRTAKDGGTIGGVAVRPGRPGAVRAQPAAEQRHSISRNGYTYEIDQAGRTRRVSGELDMAEVAVRSRTEQARAGGSERRKTDDGGHYIAARFKGPTEAYNHFAQDASFNRGRYRALEDQWARAKRAGKTVSVSIVPLYDDRSKRPSVIDIYFRIDGHNQSVKIPNERTEKRNGKRRN